MKIITTESIIIGICKEMNLENISIKDICNLIYFIYDYATSIDYSDSTLSSYNVQPSSLINEIERCVYNNENIMTLNNKVIKIHDMEKLMSIEIDNNIEDAIKIYTDKLRSQKLK